MQTPPKKKKRTLRTGRRLLLCCLAAALLLGIGGIYWATRPAPVPPAPAAKDTATSLVSREEATLASITVASPRGENYTLRYENGTLWYEGEEPFQVESILAEDILAACTQLTSMETLSDDPAEYGGDLAAFGLEPPQCTVTITYTRGEPVTYDIGARLPLEGGYYFRLEGDDSLYRVHDDILDIFQVEAGVLYPVDQVRLTAALIEGLSVYTGTGRLLCVFARQKDGSFSLTEPVRYPVDAETFDSLLTALANFRLGAYMGSDTPENRAALGLGEAEYRLVIREGEGAAAQTNAAGALTGSLKPAAEAVVTLWPLNGEAAGYCEVGGRLYRFYRLSLEFLYTLDLTRDTLSLTPADIPLEDLAALTVTVGDSRDEYRLTRTERVLENNALETDAQGSVLYDTTVTRNGEPMRLDAFAARLEALNAIRVGGRLPQGFTPGEAPAGTMVFTTRSGLTRTVTLAPYDALHNAVGVDGVYLFYLVKGGLSF